MGVGRRSYLAGASINAWRSCRIVIGQLLGKRILDAGEFILCWSVAKTFRLLQSVFVAASGSDCTTRNELAQIAESVTNPPADADIFQRIPPAAAPDRQRAGRYFQELCGFLFSLECFWIFGLVERSEQRSQPRWGFFALVSQPSKNFINIHRSTFLLMAISFY
jgi:hypothetical protein